MRLGFAAVASTAVALFSAPTVSADPPGPGCERVPIFGLNPYVREICDMPIAADGSWMRGRLQHYIGGYQSTCGGRSYQGGECPPWATRDWVPDRYVFDKYLVTWDTIPPGEPGHLD